MAKARNDSLGVLAGALLAACNVEGSSETGTSIDTSSDAGTKKPDAANTRLDAGVTQRDAAAPTAPTPDCDAGPPPAPNTSQCARACGGGCGPGCEVLEARLYDRERQCRGEPRFAECVDEGYLDNDFPADGQCAIDRDGRVFYTTMRMLDTRTWNGWTECSNAFTQEVFAAPKCSELE